MYVSLPQTLVVITIVICVTVLTVLHDINGDVILPFFTAVVGGAIGYVNGKNGGPPIPPPDKKE